MTNYILQQIKDKQLKSSKTEQLPYLKIMDSEPLLPSMEDKKYDTMMEHIRQLLDKRKPRTVVIPVQQKTKGGRSLNKRHMVEVRFKEQYLSRQQQVQTQVTHDSVLRDSQTARVLEYQQRIGLVKRKTKCDLQLQQIAQKHNIRW